jgi:hypothetical protein
VRLDGKLLDFLGFKHIFNSPLQYADGKLRNADGMLCEVDGQLWGCCGPLI